MTTKESLPGDNRGLCESCNDPATIDQMQFTYPVLLGGGIGWGTMWLCQSCLDRHRVRDDAIRTLGQAFRTLGQLARIAG